MKRSSLYGLVICCSLACLFFGCTRFRSALSVGKAPTESTNNFYTRQNYDFSFIKKIAVVPFDNLTNEKFAAEHIRRLVINEVLASGLSDVIVPGELGTAFKTARPESAGSLSPEDIKKIGKSLNAEAILTGSVERYEEPKGGSFAAPEVSISLIMYETDSAAIIWSVNASTGGASFMTRHFGARSDTLSEASEKVVRKAISTLSP